jgi:5-methyltetrahydropteroyltriglutamate--homocysteine methyltransferase
MALLTTTIGAYPKPDYLPVLDWFRMEEGTDASHPTEGYLESVAAMGDQAESLFRRATGDVVRDQVEAGIDVPTDGEVRRENYIHYHCRHLEGVDFEVLNSKALRAGAFTAEVPSITGPIKARAPFLPDDWKLAQSFTDRPVKITLPGPMTVGDSTVDLHYGDEEKRGADLADALNAEVRALAEAGCTWIQVDEPVFARYPDRVLDYGIDHLERCFAGVPPRVKRAMHMCCSYPDKLDRKDYPKADAGSYFRIAEALDRSSIEAVSIEDAHRHNDLSLLERFQRACVVFGAVDIASSRVEPVEEIVARLEEALTHIDADRLIAAPDCGLGLLGRDLAIAKLRNLSAAARAFGTT